MNEIATYREFASALEQSYAAFCQVDEQNNICVASQIYEFRKHMGEYPKFTTETASLFVARLADFFVQTPEMCTLCLKNQVARLSVDIQPVRIIKKMFLSLCNFS